MWKTGKITEYTWFLLSFPLTAFTSVLVIPFYISPPIQTQHLLGQMTMVLQHKSCFWLRKHAKVGNMSYISLSKVQEATSIYKILLLKFQPRHFNSFHTVSMDTVANRPKFAYDGLFYLIYGFILVLSIFSFIILFNWTVITSVIYSLPPTILV